MCSFTRATFCALSYVCSLIPVPARVRSQWRVVFSHTVPSSAHSHLSASIRACPLRRVLLFAYNIRIFTHARAYARSFARVIARALIRAPSLFCARSCRFSLVKCVCSHRRARPRRAHALQRACALNLYARVVARSQACPHSCPDCSDICSRACSYYVREISCVRRVLFHVCAFSLRSHICVCSRVRKLTYSHLFFSALWVTAVLNNCGTPI